MDRLIPIRMPLPRPLRRRTESAGGFLPCLSVFRVWIALGSAVLPAAGGLVMVGDCDALAGIGGPGWVAP